MSDDIIEKEPIEVPQATPPNRGAKSSVPTLAANGDVQGAEPRPSAPQAESPTVAPVDGVRPDVPQATPSR